MQIWTQSCTCRYTKLRFKSRFCTFWLGLLRKPVNTKINWVLKKLMRLDAIFSCINLQAFLREPSPKKFHLKYRELEKNFPKSLHKALDAESLEIYRLVPKLIYLMPSAWLLGLHCYHWSSKSLIFETKDWRGCLIRNLIEVLGPFWQMHPRKSDILLLTTFLRKLRGDNGK